MSLYFWIPALVIFISVGAAILRPLLSRREMPSDEAAPSSLTTLHTQRTDIVTQYQNGLLSEDEMRAAQREIERRLLTLARALRQQTEPSKPAGRNAPALIITAIVLSAGVGLYLLLGRPDLPDHAYAQRLAHLAALETQASQEPGDIPRQIELALAQARLDRHGEAAESYRRAITFWPDPASVPDDLLEAFAEQLTLAANGQVPDLARQTFQLVFNEWKKAPDGACPWRSGYYLGLAALQAGQPGTARLLWADILACGSRADPWYALVDEAFRNLPSP